jgi:hypothetical protein
MSDRDDEVMLAFVRELSADPPLPEQLKERIWNGTQQKIAAGIVVAGSAVTAIAAARAASTSSTAAASATAYLPSAPSLSSILGTTAGKAIVLAALAVGGVLGAAGHKVVVDAPLATATTGAGVDVAPPAPPPRPAGLVEEPAPAPAAVASAPAPARRPKAERRVPAAAEVTKEEFLVVDEARTALKRHDGEAALEAIGRQRALPAPRALDEEVDGLEVLAVAIGDRTRAQALARAFLARWPESALEQRIRPIADTNLDHGSVP